MRRWCFALALFVIACLPRPAEGADNPCEGIRLGYHESIDGQGFFGVLTPKTDARLARQALERNIEAAKPGPPGEYPGMGTVVFNWAGVCELAKTRGIRVLWVGCHSDTDEESGEYYGSLATSRDKVGLINATCVVSAWSKSKKPSWGDLVEYALIHTGGDRKTIYPHESESDGDRYDQLKKQEVRLELYISALNNSVSIMSTDTKH